MTQKLAGNTGSQAARKNGTDALYSTSVEIDDDVREEYWIKIRNKPELKAVKSLRCPGKYSR